MSAAVGAVPLPRQQMIEKQDWTYLQGTGQWNKTAHADGQGASGLAFSLDGITLVSRYEMREGAWFFHDGGWTVSSVVCI